MYIVTVMCNFKLITNVIDLAARKGMRNVVHCITMRYYRRDNILWFGPEPRIVLK